MHGCSGAILVLNVLDDSACQLKGKEGRSLGYSVTLGTFFLVLFQTHTLSIFLVLFIYFSLTHTHAYTSTCVQTSALLSCAAVFTFQHSSPSFPGMQLHLQVHRRAPRLLLPFLLLISLFPLLNQETNHF